MKNNDLNLDLILTEKLIINATTQRWDNFYSFYKHMHPTIEFFYIIQGTLNVNISNHIVTCSENDFLLIPPNVVHTLYLTTKAPCVFKLVHFSTDILSQLSLEKALGSSIDIISALNSCYTLYYKTSNNPQIHYLVSEIVSEYNKTNIFSNSSSNLYLIQLLLHILDSSKINFSKSVSANSNQNLYINKTLTYIKQNYNTKFLISDLADSLHISSRYLSKIFYEHMNMTLLSYINVYRMNQAIELMQNTDLTLTEIALKIGMNDSQHFSKLFHSIIGSTPFQYRKELKLQTKTSL